MPSQNILQTQNDILKKNNPNLVELTTSQVAPPQEIRGKEPCVSQDSNTYPSSSSASSSRSLDTSHVTSISQGASVSQTNTEQSPNTADVISDMELLFRGVSKLRGIF